MIQDNEGRIYNKAYDAGVVLVCAAGNSFAGLPMSLIVYPARFNRVIAACGVMAKYHPYHALGGQMEGNVGPANKMATALSAYTPNIPWLRLGCEDVIDMDGNGTSSATPQIAAAAALWLAKNGAAYNRGWQRVEAVRQALFGSAVVPPNSSGQPDPNFGRGLLRAQAALALRPDAQKLVTTPPDDASFAFLHLLSSVFGVDGAAADSRVNEMFALELTQLALNSRGAREAVPEPHLPPEQIPNRARRRMLEAILDERTCSQALRGHLEKILGRAGVGGTVMVSNPPGAQPPRTGAEIARRVVHQPPAYRRLRIFATDPSDSAQLGTSFINTATVDIPWEKDLQPGPVGEYLEVIDVDPASSAAYEPVDLTDRHLLAQDGLPPSEGHPQFHQQMVYAVAMRTIRNFEIALGRRALWAERRMSRPGEPFRPAPNGGYVGRLRIYPHALRERNAYYSPDRKALLFGYFDAAALGGSSRTVFTCLSHDVVAHETTHALLDGLHPRFQEKTNDDVLAFHEAFADIVALFQHFTFPELLRYQVAQLRGNLRQESILSDLARQFGKALHNNRALRRALDPKPDEPEPTSMV
ncbi:MAG: S8 family serine peptidase [Rhodopila sp.]